MQFEIKHIISVVITSLFMLLSIFLFTQKRENRTSNIILAVYLFSIALLFMDGVLRLFDEFIFNNIPQVFYISFPFPFLYPPFLYLYAKSLTESEFTFDKKYLLHLIPFIAALFVIVFRYHIHSPDVQREMLLAGNRSNPIFTGAEITIYTLLNFVQFLIYAIITLILLRRYRLEIKKYYASVELINLSWLKFVVIGFIVWDVLNLAHYIYTLTTGVYSIAVNILIQLFMMVLASVIVYKGLSHPEIFLGFNNFSSRIKYKKSKLPETEKKQYLDTLLNYMDTNKPYLDPSLNLHSLAEQVSISAHHLSQVINELLSRNFFDFVNSYRIEESKKILSENGSKSKTVSEIIYETGFNSKSVFNTAFKKNTGMTPTEFRKNQNYH